MSLLIIMKMKQDPDKIKKKNQQVKENNELKK